MIKKAFSVALASGAFHVVQAERFVVEGHDAAFFADGVKIAHFQRFESIIVEQAPAPAIVSTLSVPGEVAAFEPAAAVSIQTLNITIAGDVCPASVGAAVQALAEARAELAAMR